MSFLVNSFMSLFCLRCFNFFKIVTFFSVSGKVVDGLLIMRKIEVTFISGITFFSGFHIFIFGQE